MTHQQSLADGNVVIEANSITRPPGQGASAPGSGQRPIPAPGHVGVDYEARVDFERLRRYRVARAKAALESSECGAFLLFDFYNIRYTTQTWIGGALGDLRQQDLEGGSITISNLGMYGVDEFVAIINPPQSAILAVGAARPAVQAVDGELAVVTAANLVLSADHRAIDGALAAQWMAALAEILETPIRLVV